MTNQDWIGIIGAAAWLPQIGGWISSYFNKPQINLVPAHVPEVGYTIFGPIFNLTCAISADVRDALISGMSVVIRHENGQELHLNWKALNETFSNIRSTSGETATVTKSQPAIALKVSTDALSEKMIQFQDFKYQAEMKRLTAAVDEQKMYFQKVGGDVNAQVFKSKQFLDLMDFYKRNSFWTTGEYIFTVTMILVGVKHNTEKTFKFSLSKTDIERLALNTTHIEQHLKDILNPPTPPVKDYPYQWANPTIQI